MKFEKKLIYLKLFFFFLLFFVCLVFHVPSTLVTWFTFSINQDILALVLTFLGIIIILLFRKWFQSENFHENVGKVKIAFAIFTLVVFFLVNLFLIGCITVVLTDGYINFPMELDLGIIKIVRVYFTDTELADFCYNYLQQLNKEHLNMHVENVVKKSNHNRGECIRLLQNLAKEDNNLCGLPRSNFYFLVKISLFFVGFSFLLSLFCGNSS